MLGTKGNAPFLFLVTIAYITPNSPVVPTKNGTCPSENNIQSGAKIFTSPNPNASFFIKSNIKYLNSKLARIVIENLINIVLYSKPISLPAIIANIVIMIDTTSEAIIFLMSDIDCIIKQPEIRQIDILNKFIPSNLYPIPKNEINNSISDKM
ncbi:MAG: hypothetical protein RL208_144 [Pseudomonadota bacterium]